MTSGGLNIEVVSPKYYLTEGPFWCEDEQALYYIAMFEHKICRYHPGTKKITSLTINKKDATTDTLLTLVLPHATERNKFIVSLNRRLGVVTWPDVTCDAVDANFELLYDSDVDRPNNRLNDAKCDAMGRVWAGTMGPTDLPDDKVPNQGRLYCFDLEGQALRASDQISLSNGLDWDEKNKVFYFVDSAKYKVYAFDYNSEEPRIENRRDVVDFRDDLGTTAFPDGMAIDTAGKLWVASFGNGKVYCIDPISKSVLETVEIPIKSVTSVCFGGSNLDELYVTTTAKVINGDDDPNAGAVYRVTGIKAKGYPSNRAKIPLKLCKS